MWWFARPDSSRPVPPQICLWRKGVHALKVEHSGWGCRGAARSRAAGASQSRWTEDPPIAACNPLWFVLWRSFCCLLLFDVLSSAACLSILLLRWTMTRALLLQDQRLKHTMHSRKRCAQDSSLPSLSLPPFACRSSMATRGARQFREGFTLPVPPSQPRRAARGSSRRCGRAATLGEFVGGQDDDDVFGHGFAIDEML